jgi:hypothetical protein
LNGVVYDNSIASIGTYSIKKNDQPFQQICLSNSSSGSYTISNHAFNLDTISYHNDNTSLYIRNTVYDSLGNLYAWARYDRMTHLNTTVKTDIYGYNDGIYTSEVFGWNSDGKLTNVSNITFINYICADVDNGGDVNIGDVTYLVEYIFNQGPILPHPASGDMDCNGGIDISDLTILIDYLFDSGPAPECCHSL